jgi:alkaline phosphatase
MKFRNQLLALVCLLVFIGVGVLYFRTWVVQKPFAIILFVGDGLAPAYLTAARMFDGGADHRLTLEKLPNMALLTTHSNDFAVPDAPAAATALATGVKVNNRSIAMSVQGAPLESIIDAARRAGRAVGIVTNGRLTDAGSAAFYAHASSSEDIGAISAQFVDAGKLDVALGGGAHDFIPEAKGGRRKDGRDLLVEMKGKDMRGVDRSGAVPDAAIHRHLWEWTARIWKPGRWAAAFPHGDGAARHSDAPA